MAAGSKVTLELKDFPGHDHDVVVGYHVGPAEKPKYGEVVFDKDTGRAQVPVEVAEHFEAHPDIAPNIRRVQSTTEKLMASVKGKKDAGEQEDNA